MTQGTPVLRELLNVDLVEAHDGSGPFYREWYCEPPPGSALFTIIRSEWQDDGLITPTQRVYQIRTLITCAAPNCENQVRPPRRRFCSETCARRGRRHEKNVENPEFGQAAVRMVRAMARRVGASDIAAFGMLWEFQDEIADAVVDAVDGLREKGFTWQEMADEIGVSRNAISQWRDRHAAKRDARDGT